MHSDWSLWEFNKGHTYSYSEEHEGIQLLEIPDPFIGTVLKERIKQGPRKFKVLHAHEITVSWLEEEFCNLSFLVSDESFIIQNANLISSSVVEFLAENNISWNDRLLVLLSYGKNDKLSKWAKKEAACFTLKAPKFWEAHEYFNYFADHFGVKVHYDGIQYILDSIVHEPAYFFETCSFLSTLFPKDKLIELKDIRSLVKKSKLDYFELARDASLKNWGSFYSRLLSVEFDYESLRSVFSFLLGHFVKVYDPSYTTTKKHLSKYDKEIMTNSKLWEKQEVINLMDKLSNWERKTRLKDPYLQSEIQRARLQAL